MAETVKDLRSRATKLHQDGALLEAAKLYAVYLKHEPSDAGIWSNLGVLHRSAGRHEQSLRAQKRALAIAPDEVGFRNNIANILSDTGQYEASITHRKWVLDREPDNLNHIAMVGRCLRGLGDYAGAIAYLTPQIAIHPDDTELQMQLAFAQLGAGDYAHAFETYKIRWKTGELTARDLPFPEWQGEPLEGKTVLVMPEQGFGDAVLFARFLPVLKDMGATVHCLVERPVATLFENLDGADWIGQGIPRDARIDYYVNMMDLAGVHFSKTNDVPAPARMNVPSESTERAARIVAPYDIVLKIGVVWAGSVTYKGNAFRSFSHTDFLPLTDIEGVQLFSLYKGPMLDPYFADGTSAFIVDAASDESGFSDTAASMQAMDLIITSDTATAHIAGSLGVPTWTVLHWDPFWVWTHVGDTTPWYQNMTLFRQKTPLQWSGVMAELQAALSQYLEDHT
ncbi:MAG: Tfp pilus assembly protein PilF [Yoonia sp.]|jgi:Tfp pilus assembly protein PilF